MPYEPPPELAGLSLSEIAALVEQRKLPPVEQWRPQAVGDSDMRIAADGAWYHQGGKITRPAMVRAFSALLMRDGDEHWLVTPRQKLSIVVEDAAFVAVDMKREANHLAFRLNTDELVIAGPEHPLTARGSVETPAIYLAARQGLEARLNRSTWIQLAEIAAEYDHPQVESQGAVFSLIPQ